MPGRICCLQSTGSIFKLGARRCSGREDPTLQIDLEGYPDGKYVSHRHAQIVKMDDKYYIEDLGSSNHTWVNEIKLAQGQAEPLKEGDVIKLGKIELTFHEVIESSDKRIDLQGRELLKTWQLTASTSVR